MLTKATLDGSEIELGKYCDYETYPGTGMLAGMIIVAYVDTKSLDEIS
jgi:hypothetical protein